MGRCECRSTVATTKDSLPGSLGPGGQALGGGQKRGVEEAVRESNQCARGRPENEQTQPLGCSHRVSRAFGNPPPNRASLPCG